MLEELKNINYSPSQEGLTYFLCDVIGKNKYRLEDIEIICNHAPGRLQLSPRHLLIYCLAFKWIINEEGLYFATDEIISDFYKPTQFKETLIKDSINVLFDAGVLSVQMFEYESISDQIRFKNELLPLEYSGVRNTLVNQGLLEIVRNPSRSLFYLSEAYTSIIGEKIRVQKKKYSLEQLKQRLEDNERAGELAEEFVLNYERGRLPDIKKDRIRIISSIDVTAGYDIVSFESDESAEIDRFIEVKAVSQGNGFFWSENEFEVAKLKGKQYYLYLINLAKIGTKNYKPLMICDPASTIMNSPEWLVETQTYHIRRVPNF